MKELRSNQSSSLLETAGAAAVVSAERIGEPTSAGWPANEIPDRLQTRQNRTWNVGRVIVASVERAVAAVGDAALPCPGGRGRGGERKGARTCSACTGWTLPSAHASIVRRYDTAGKAKNQRAGSQNNSQNNKPKQCKPEQYPQMQQRPGWSRTFVCALT